MTCPACKGSRERIVTVRATRDLAPKLPPAVADKPAVAAYAVCDVCSGNGKIPAPPEPVEVQP